SAHAARSGSAGGAAAGEPGVSRQRATKATHAAARGDMAVMTSLAQGRREEPRWLFSGCWVGATRAGPSTLRRQGKTRGAVMRSWLPFLGVTLLLGFAASQARGVYYVPAAITDGGRSAL